MMARSWLVLVMTESPFLVGIANAVIAIPMFFGLGGGIIADRFDRKKILIFSRTINIVLAIVMAVLISTDVIQFWHVILIILVSGVINAISMPSRSIFLLDIVGENDLVNATGLNRLTTAIMGIIGSYIGGVLIDLFSISYCYYFEALMRTFSLIIFYLINVKSMASVEKKNPLKDLMEGFRYIRNDQSLIGLLSTAIFWNLFLSMQGFRMTLLPIFARNILLVGAKGYGLLMSAQKFGSLIGSLLIANLGKFKHKGLLLIISAEIMGVMVILFSIVKLFPLSLILWAGDGIMSSIFNSSLQVLLLTTASEEMKGRVMGARFQAIMLMPINALWAGLIAESNPSLALFLGGVLWEISIFATAILLPKFRKLE
jgi:MFS family permease